MELVNPTLASLEAWHELILEGKEEWRQLLADDKWKDLPPDVTKTILKAAKALANAADVVEEHLNSTVDLERYDRNARINNDADADGA